MLGSFLADNKLYIILAILWVLPWKGLALWRAAHERSKVWFIVILLVNTMGVLEIIYYFFISKKKNLSLMKVADQSSPNGTAK